MFRPELGTVAQLLLHRQDGSTLNAGSLASLLYSTKSKLFYVYTSNVII